MIDEIHVSNVALIRDASFSPSRGLTAITGETGAGKTALLSACKLLVGERADKTAVREGSDGLTVEGRLFFDDAADIPEGAELEDGEAVVCRRVSIDGRSRASINGHMASAKEIARLVAPTLDLCSQHEHQALMRPATHLSLLDAWARDSVSKAHANYVSAFDAAKRAADELARVKAAGEASTARLDEARFTLQRIDSVGVSDEGEYEELAARLEKAENAESLVSATNCAYESLSGEGGAIDALDAAASALEGASAYDKTLAELASSLRESSYVLEDVSREALSYRDSVEFDGDALEEAQERMAALQGLLRAFGPRLSDVIAAREEAAELVSLVDDAEERERAAVQALEEAERELAEAASTLDAARRKMAPRFAQAVSKVMARLEMGSASLECEVSELPREKWTKEGPHQVEFMFRPGSGMQARPLARIASGGELSRIMLALRSVLNEKYGVGVSIYDEIDTGISGRTARKVGIKLRRIARCGQVICVTHSAQIASLADAQYRIEKHEVDGRAETSVRCLEPEERVDEIARILGGLDLTDSQRAAARELIAEGERL